MKNSTYEIVTERILQSLEAGVIPWRKPWHSGGLTYNLVSNKPYRGINVFLTVLSEFASPYWLTFNQARQLGGHVNKGAKATMVVFWKTGKYEAEDEDGDKESRTSFLLRFYHVFNVEQVTFPAESLGARLIATRTAMLGIERKAENIPSCESIVAGYHGPTLKHGKMYEAAYHPLTDTVKMPTQAQFKTDEGYFAVLFHELVHSTGHKTRLDRPGVTDGARFGSEKYGKEELIAECGSAFLCAIAGIDKPALTENTTAYLQNWIKAIKGDPKLLVKAAAAAQSAVDLIRNETKEKGAEVESGELVAA